MRSVVALALLLPLGCNPGANDTASDVPWETAQSAKDRDTSPDVPAEDAQALADGNLAFALDLYHVLAAGSEGDLFLSPLSVSIALAMTWGGARGETEAQMADTLHFTLAQDALHPAWNALDLALESTNERAVEQEIPVELSIANALWGQVGFPFLDEYLDLLAVNYGAGLRLLDFAADAEAARGTINDWVADQTEDRIPDLIPAGVLSADTVLVLTNAVYFLAAWNLPFDEDQTADGAFTRVDGSSVTVPFMHQVEQFPYSEGDGWQAVELPYDGEQLSMVLVLPDEGTFSSFESALDASTLQGIMDGLSTAQVTLGLPRFGTESEFSLADTLKALGMTDAFDGARADFSGMSDLGPLYISDVIHKSYIQVDEAGTEAAAATAVVMDFGSAGEPVEMSLDRPFLYLIRDVETGSVLFLGRLMDPT